MKDPVFKATMVRMTNPSSERFHISGELIAAELPKQLLLSDASAVMTVSGIPVVPGSPAGAPTSAVAAPIKVAATPTPVPAQPVATTDAARKGPPASEKRP